MDICKNLSEYKYDIKLGLKVGAYKPEKKEVLPLYFIETLEEYHLIHRLDMFVVERVCRDIKDAKQKGRKIIPTSLNFSRLDFDSLNLAKDLGIQTLAEGVENQEQYDFLREIGCEKLQGYLFSKPVSRPELEAKLDDGSFVIY